ncbi:hypothetical protein [Mesorhizobium sp. L-2-11]|nr:hypothetical protein [Mesorhizobium sp. L-2-11]
MGVIPLDGDGLDLAWLHYQFLIGVVKIGELRNRAPEVKPS